MPFVRSNKRARWSLGNAIIRELSTKFKSCTKLMGIQNARQRDKEFTFMFENGFDVAGPPDMWSWNVYFMRAALRSCQFQIEIYKNRFNLPVSALQFRIIAGLLFIQRGKYGAMRCDGSYLYLNQFSLHRLIKNRTKWFWMRTTDQNLLSDYFCSLSVLRTAHFRIYFINFILSIAVLWCIRSPGLLRSRPFYVFVPKLRY